MKKEEFFNTCVKSGYCSRRTAMMYANKTGKEEFTEDDFIEVYRIRERALDVARDNSKFQMVEGVRTTKRYKQSEKMGSDRT